MMTTSIRALACLLAIVATGVATGCGRGKEPPKAPPPREVAVLTLQPSELRDTGEYLGTLLSRASVNVFPQVNGYVKKIHVRPGAVVKAGDALIDIDSREESAALQSAVADRGAVQARLELARANLARVEALNREGLAPAQELDQARSELAAAQATAVAASAGVAQREVQLEFHTVRAAIGGTLGEVLVRIGDAVTPSTQVTTVAPPPEGAPQPAAGTPDTKANRDVAEKDAKAAALEVNVSIPAERARELAMSSPLEILDRDGNVLVSAPIFYAAPQADPRTQLVAVKAAFQNTLGLRPSEIVRTRVVYRTSSALQVPAIAVVRQSGQPFVFVVTQKEGKTLLERRPVKLGRLGPTSYVVEGGLQPGDRVATSSLQMLKDGMAVVPKEAAHPNEAATPHEATTSKPAKGG